MIENYIAKSVDCACGRPHRSKTEHIAIRQGVIDGALIPFLLERGYKRLTVVCDENTYRVAAEQVCKALEQASIGYKLHKYTGVVLPNEHFIGNLTLGADLGCDLLLAVGSGTIGDICRYVSALMGKDYCIVGTAPSMDGYNSGSSALIFNNTKITYETHTPLAVFLDPDILAAAPMPMIASGAGDLLGKINCITDWRLSRIVTGEWFCDFIAGIVDAAVEKVLKNAAGLAEQNADAIGDLVEALLLSGVGMDFAGNSRPASGCEHHLSHFWEMRYLLEGREAVFHGTKVGIGTVITLKAYEYIARLNPDFAAIRQLPRKTADQWEAEIREAFLGASEEILALERKAGKNSPEKLAIRLDAIEANWEQIRALAAATPKATVVRDILVSMDAPTQPAQIGVEKEMARQAICYAKELRDRYTVLQLLWDLGELEHFADQIIDEYYA